MIEVAAGILTDTSGRVLLMQRLPGKHLAGLWEFPGGKLEPGETIEQALSRELDEELGIRVVESAPLISIPWCYPGKTVRLHAWRVTAWHGEPHAREGHPLRWVHMRDLDVATMPPADVPIVTALRLPAYYAIAAGGQAGCTELGPVPTKEPLAHRVSRELQDMHTPARAPQPPSVARWAPSAPGLLGREGWGEGAASLDRLYQLRMPDAPRADIRRIARRWLDADPSLRTRLLINHDIGLAQELEVGVHLRSAQMRDLQQRPLPRDAWVGASCHDADELELAACLGADFATLSPVCVTASHPNAIPFGWQRFAQLVAGAQLPVYALGGVGPDDLASARAAGAQGVAGVRAFR